MLTPDTSREAFDAAAIALWGSPIDWDAPLPRDVYADVEGEWPGYMRVGSDCVADRWTGEAPW